MFHTTRPRRVLKLAEKKSEKHNIPVARKSFRNQSKTFSDYGQKYTCPETQKPRSMTVSGSSKISPRNRYDIQRVRNFEIICEGLEYCGDSYQCFDKIEEVSDDYFTYQSFGGQNGVRGEAIRRQVTVLGSPKVGKTSLIQRLRRLGNISIIKTHGDTGSSRGILIRVGDQLVNLVFHEMDMCTQREIPYKASDAFLVMYSLEDRRSMITTAQIVRRIRNKYRSTSPIFVVANKMDLVRNDSVTKGDGKFLAREYRCTYFETSLSPQTDLNDLLVAITKQIFVKDAVCNDKLKSQSISRESLTTKKKMAEGPIQRLFSKIFPYKKYQRLVLKGSCESIFQM